jgi:hypothetical protein
MVFDTVAEYERFNKMYRDYMEKGIDSTKAFEMAKEAFCPSKPLSEEGRKIYDDYIFKFGLSPEDAYILASRKNGSGQVEEQGKEIEKKKVEEQTSPVKKWLDEWTVPADKWFDTLMPFNRFFNDSFFKNFGMPCWLDWNKQHNADKKSDKEEKCQCKCDNSKLDSKPAVCGSDIVNDEIKKVLGEIPKEEVNAKNTKVNIVKSDPDDYEYKVDHTSSDGKSNFFCHKIYKKF